MKSRLLVAAVGVPLIFWLILWAPVWALAWALAALSGVAAYELMKCAGATGAGGPLCWLTVAWALGAVFVQWARPAWMLPLLILYCLLSFGAAVRRAGEVKFHHIMAGFFAVSAIPYAFSSFLRLSGLGLHRAFLLLPVPGEAQAGPPGQPPQDRGGGPGRPGGQRPVGGALRPGDERGP